MLDVMAQVAKRLPKIRAGAVTKENGLLHNENQRLRSENETLKEKINKGPELSMRNATPQEAPGPIKIDGEDEFVVKEIIDCRLFENKIITVHIAANHKPASLIIKS